MIENFRDVAHFAFVHQATLGPMPEVVEPLMPERERARGDDAPEDASGREAPARVWGSLREMRYHAIAPNFISVRMFTDEGERCLLHAARAISATESAHYWIEGGWRISTRSASTRRSPTTRGSTPRTVAIISAIEPPELPLDPSAEVNSLADRLTLAYREAYLEFVNRALAARLTRAGAVAD